jgi:superfamily I DNA/RNA helicase
LLDKYQRKVVEHPLKPKSLLLVASGSGSGKSTTAVNCVHSLIERESILDVTKIEMLTFTNEAVRDLQRKYDSTFPYSTNNPKVKTIHSWMLTHLKREEKFKGYKVAMSLHKIARESAEELGYLDEGKIDPARIPMFIHQLCSVSSAYFLCDISSLEDIGKPKNEKIFSRLPADELSRLLFKEDVFIDIFSLMMYKTQEAKIYTFDMIVWIGKHHLEEDKKFLKKVANYRLLLVDECQDSSKVALECYRLVQKATKKGAMVLIYDLQQSIYKFAYAHPDGLKVFEDGKVAKDTTRLTLQYNYRSKHGIVDSANIFRKYNGYEESIAYDKPSEESTPIEIHSTLSNTLEGVKVVDLIKYEILKGTLPEDIAVIVRTNKVLKEVIEPALIQANIPYNIMGKSTGAKLLERGLTEYLYQAILYILDPNTIYIQNIVEILKDAGFMIDVDRRSDIKQVVVDVLVNKKEYSSVSLILGALLEGLVGVLELWGDRKLALKFTEDMGSIRSSILNLTLGLVHKEGSNKGVKHNLKLTLKAIQEFEQGIKKDKVVLSSIHQSKGLEWEVTIIAGVTHRVQPRDTYNDLSEKCYVQLTRAKRKIHIVKSLLYISEADENNILEEKGDTQGVVLELVDMYMKFAQSKGHLVVRGFKI